MKIGIVDLDTSHPQNWIPIERELGHEVVGLWDRAVPTLNDYAPPYEKFSESRRNIAEVILEFRSNGK